MHDDPPQRLSARALEIIGIIERATSPTEDLDALAGELEAAAQPLVALGHALLELDPPETAEPVLRDEIEAGIDAAEGFLAALETARRAIEEGDAALLDAACSMVAEADARLHEALDLNGKSRASLEATYLDSSWLV